MPAKKTKKIEKKTTFGSMDIKNYIQTTDSYKSLIYGIITVIVLFIVIALGIRTLQQNKAQIDEEALSTQNTTQQTKSDQYTVNEGDTLWSIAQESYNDGFKWVEIAKANNLDGTSVIEKGMKLNIPKIEANTNNDKEAVSPTQAVNPTVVVSPITSAPAKTTESEDLPGPKITGTTYKIVEGDNLWNISIRAFGNGYRWVEIAKINNIANPDLIYPETTLRLPSK